MYLVKTAIGGVPDVWGAQFPPLSSANPKPTLSKHTPVLGLIRSRENSKRPPNFWLLTWGQPDLDNISICVHSQIGLATAGYI